MKLIISQIWTQMDGSLIQRMCLFVDVPNVKDLEVQSIFPQTLWFREACNIYKQGCSIEFLNNPNSKVM